MPQPGSRDEEGEAQLSPEDLQDAIQSAEEDAIVDAINTLRERDALDGNIIALALPPDLILSSRAPVGGLGFCTQTFLHGSHILAELGLDLTLTDLCW